MCLTWERGTDMKKLFGENYLSFISIAVGSVAVIAAIVWGITVYVRRQHTAGC